MNFWFFFSYARLDRDEYLKQFYEDLKNEVRTQLGETNADAVGFFDAESIEPGAQWDEVLAQALCHCRAFVSIFSPTYFQKEYCGKEWTVFRQRLEEQCVAQAAPPPLIFPVLWVPENKLPQPLPPAVADIQYKHDDFGANYAKYGLKQLLKLSRYRDEYNEFVFNLAAKLTEAVQQHALPVHTKLPPLDQVPSAFQAPAGDPLAPSGTVTSGPRYVQFIYVAEKRSALEKLRKQLDAYGVEGGKDWLPYFPAVKEEVGLLAQDAAVREKLYYEEVRLTNELVNELRKAERDNKIVVIIVDTWTLRLAEYKQIMRSYDDHNFINCVVLVPWNQHDDETLAHQHELETNIHQAFVKLKLAGSPHAFLYPVCSLDELRRELSVALNKARERILEKAKIEKIVESSKPIFKPVIHGPGGGPVG